MGVAPNGRIDVIWNDTRNHPGEFLSELYYAYSLDGGETWSENVSVTPPFDPHVGWPQQNKMGDYFDIASDNLGANVAFATTLNDEQDVYFVRVGPTVQGDFDADGDVDVRDYSVLADCLAGPGVAPDPQQTGVIRRDCLHVFDHGDDGPDDDVDLADIAAFQRMFTGNRILRVDAGVVDGAGDGSSWSNAFAGLTEALQNARSGDEIWVAAGAYVPQESGDGRKTTYPLVDGVGVYGGFAGDEVDRDERDVIANETVLSGDIGVPGDPSDNCYRVVLADGTRGGTRLDGFVITGGRADGPDSFDRGAGVLVRRGRLRLANCRVVGNEAASGGGLMSIDGDTTIVNCSFSGNVSQVWAGGAIFNLGGTTRVINTSCSENVSALDFGGGVRNYEGGSMVLRNVVLWGNVATGGTAEDAQIGSHPSATLEVSYSCVQGWTGRLGGVGNIGADPRFVDPPGADGEIGTADDDLSLSGDSASIDAGSNALVPAGVEADLTGAPRIVDGDGDGTPVVDMGAYEFPS
jgi:hypothetical protein